ncbi:unnamed protein product [Orchesella dallaii]
MIFEEDVAEVESAFGTLLFPRKPIGAAVSADGKIYNCSVLFTLKVGDDGELGKMLNISVRGSVIDYLLANVINKSSLKLKYVATLISKDDNDDIMNEIKVDINSKELEATLSGPPYEQKYAYDYQVPLNDHDLRFWKCRRFYLKVTMEFVACEADLLGIERPSLMQVEKRMLEEQLHADFTLVADDGTGIRCHKAILASRSPVFQRMLATDMTETKNDSCQMRMSKNGVNALLKYIYYLDVEDPLKDSIVALELLEAGHQYDIPSLEKAMKQLFTKKKSTGWLEIDVAMLLFLRALKMGAEYDDIKIAAAQALKGMWDDLIDTWMFKDFFMKDPKPFAELVSLFLKK